MFRVDRSESSARWFQRGAENHTIAGVPSAAWTRPVAKHVHSQLNSIRDLLRATASERLFESDERKGRGNDPTDRARKPRPPVFSGIKLYLPIHRPELPFLQPLTFRSFLVE